MGSFTTVVSSDDSMGFREAQFKTGNDVCETYKIGDQVPWEISIEQPGHGYFLDGWYDAHITLTDGTSIDGVVTIRNSRIHSVIWDPKEVCWARNENYDEPPREWWSEEQWWQSEWDEVQRSINLNRERLQILEATRGKSKEEAAKIRMNLLIKAMVAPIARNLDYAGVASQVLQVKPL